MATEEQQMQLEWRKLVIDKLNTLELGQGTLSKDMNDIKLTFANNAKVDALAEDLEKLKLYKAKVAGVIISLNIVAIGVGWLFQLFLHK